MHFMKTLFFVVAALCMVVSSFGASLYPQGALLRSKRNQGSTGPVHTYVKTDKHANFKWGVRHHVGKHYGGGN